MNYYNEFDPKAAAWLRELIKAKVISDGVVDERSITEIKPHELSGYTQCHFFAGIGGWSYALRLANWPDDQPVWTGSCPCQPFSSAGKQMGNADSRHLFPSFRRLIARCNPPVVFGEQVASGLGREWLARVQTEMASLGYATRASDLCAASVGSPNIRQRLYWVADADGGKPRNGELQPRGQHGQQPQDGFAGGRGNADNPGPQGRHERGHCTDERAPWASSVALACTDGKSRRIEPGSFPLAHGVSGRVGLLRGYGNAINPWVAKKFIEAAYN